MTESIGSSGVLPEDVKKGKLDPTSDETKNSDSSSRKDCLDKMILVLKKLDIILIPTAGGVLAWLTFFLFCGMVSIVIFASQSLFDTDPQHSYSSFLSIIGVGFLIAWACFVSGALLGFIFGIPRILPQKSLLLVSSKSEDTITKEAPIKNELYGENSNVDQISVC
jgi:predicted membrane protein